MKLPSSRFLDLEESAGRLIFSMQGCLDRHLGLRLRWPAARRKVRLRLKSVGAVARSPADMVFTVVCNTTSLPAIAAALEDIDRDLEALAERPLTSHLVQQALHITSRERLRWTKDKRLRTSGTSKIQRGQTISLAMYPVDDIEQLIRDPAKIQEWREADSGGTGPPDDRLCDKRGKIGR
jgi:hypothetical protein